VRPFPTADTVTLAQVSLFSWFHHETTFGGTIVSGLERRDGDQFIELECLHDVSITLSPSRDCDRRPGQVPGSKSFVVLDFTSY
jgi:hypothetical protein